MGLSRCHRRRADADPGPVLIETSDDSGTSSLHSRSTRWCCSPTSRCKPGTVRRDLGPYGCNMSRRIREVDAQSVQTKEPHVVRPTSGSTTVMYYYGPGMGGWGMALMIVGNLVFWGLLIFGAVLVARYIRLAA